MSNEYKFDPEVTGVPEAEPLYDAANALLDALTLNNQGDVFWIPANSDALTQLRDAVMNHIDKCQARQRLIDHPDCES